MFGFIKHTLLELLEEELQRTLLLQYATGNFRQISQTQMSKQTLPELRQITTIISRNTPLIENGCYFAT
jgi:hypothetical protein